MSRFTNEPCSSCGTDTMHYAGKCSHCGTVAVRDQYWDKRAAIMRRAFAQAKFIAGPGADAGTLRNIVDRRFKFTEVRRTRLATQRENQRPCFEGPAHGKGVQFGRGRERTRA